MIKKIQKLDTPINQNENEITIFKNEYSFLNNFYQRKIYYKGILFPTIEHAFQASKYENIDEMKKISIIQNALDAKKEGLLITPTDYWIKNKNNIMFDLLNVKFNLYNRDLREKLIQTSGKNIINGNFYHDNYWGNCYCNKCSQINKLNIIGKMLTLIRENIIYINSIGS